MLRWLQATHISLKGLFLNYCCISLVSRTIHSAFLLSNQACRAERVQCSLILKCPVTAAPVSPDGSAAGGSAQPSQHKHGSSIRFRQTLQPELTASHESELRQSSAAWRWFVGPINHSRVVRGQCLTHMDPLHHAKSSRSRGYSQRQPGSEVLL